MRNQGFQVVSKQTLKFLVSEEEDVDDFKSPKINKELRLLNLHLNRPAVLNEVAIMLYLR